MGLFDIWVEWIGEFDGLVDEWMVVCSNSIREPKKRTCHYILTNNFGHSKLLSVCGHFLLE